jgi:HSP20 family protein
LLPQQRHRLATSTSTFQEIHMFFAPALRKNNAAAAPNRNSSDFGLERFMRDTFGIAMPAFHEIDEDEQSWTLQIDVPGVPRNQLRVQISGRTVEVDTEKDCARQLRAIYQLPAEVDAERTQAHLQDGVLTLKLAKAESAVARRIEVH